MCHTVETQCVEPPNVLAYQASCFDLWLCCMADWGNLAEGIFHGAWNWTWTPAGAAINHCMCLSRPFLPLIWSHAFHTSACILLTPVSEKCVLVRASCYCCTCGLSYGSALCFWTRIWGFQVYLIPMMLDTQSSAYQGQADLNFLHMSLGQLS